MRWRAISAAARATAPSSPPRIGCRSIAGSDRFDASEAATLGRAHALAGRATGDEIETADGRRWFAPRRVEALAELLLRFPDACLVAGATDVGLWVTKQHRRLDPVIYLGEVEELQRLEIGAEAIEIGAAVTYDRLHQAIAAEYPDFGELLRRLGSTQIRNCGTMGGNIANGSPIGDSPPPLIALGAKLVLRRGERAARDRAGGFLPRLRQAGSPGGRVRRVHPPAAARSRPALRLLQDLQALRPGHHRLPRRLQSPARRKGGSPISASATAAWRGYPSAPGNARRP